MRCEARTLDDIRALGGNDAADERRFATAARVSEINLALYRTFVQPLVRADGQLAGGRVDAADASAAAAIRAVLRCQSDDGLGRPRWPSRCAQNRKPAAADNPLRRHAGERVAADRRRARRLARHERGAGRADVPRGLRLARAAGARSASTRPERGRCARRRKNPLHRELLQTRIAELKARIPVGGLREALIRGAALCRHGARRRSTSAASRSCAASAAAHDDMPLVRVQGAGARAVLHAADRSGSGARGHSRDAAGRCRASGSRRST